MSPSPRIRFVAQVLLAAFLLLPHAAGALSPGHDCAFCHGLHGGSLIPDTTDDLGVETLCLACHATQQGASAAVATHRNLNNSSFEAFNITCLDCHHPHGPPSQPENWIGSHTDAGNDGSWTEGLNARNVGTTDPTDTTPFAVIRTKEYDGDLDGFPDRASVQSCDSQLRDIQNACYLSGIRHVVFENDDPPNNVELHGWADENSDGLHDNTFGDAQGGHYDGVCEVCHTRTGHHWGWWDGNPPTTSGRQVNGHDEHNWGRACTDCHAHDNCFDRGTCGPR